MFVPINRNMYISTTPCSDVSIVCFDSEMITVQSISYLIYNQLTGIYTFKKESKLPNILLDKLVTSCYHSVGLSQACQKFVQLVFVWVMLLM